MGALSAGRFSINMALHKRHKHNLPTYVAFVDLVKAFDTVSHSMLLKILERYRAPTKLRSAIARIYSDLKIILKIGKDKAEMEQKLGVRQGDCMAPVLFFNVHGGCRNAGNLLESDGIHNGFFQHTYKLTM